MRGTFTASAALAWVLLALLELPGSASDRVSLSLDQQAKLGDAILAQSQTALSSAAVQVSIDSIVPAGVDVHPLPRAVETAMPELHGYGYVIVEEEIALVEPTARRIVAVFQRSRPQGE